MKLGSTQIGVSKTANQGNAGKRPAGANRHQAGCRAKTKGEVTMQPHARAGRWDAVAAHPLAELLACPPATGSLLNDAATCIDFDAGAVVFRQAEPCRGLYVAVSGRFQRKTERLETRLTLGPVRVGDLVELAAVLGDGCHTYTLTAQTAASALLLPIGALNQAFQQHPPLRMQLLEELAREVSRAYDICCLTRTAKVRQRGPGAQLCG
jgi:hypothetical protein